MPWRNRAGNRCPRGSRAPFDDIRILAPYRKRAWRQIPPGPSYYCYGPVPNGGQRTVSGCFLFENQFSKYPPWSDAQLGCWLSGKMGSCPVTKARARNDSSWTKTMSILSSWTEGMFDRFSNSQQARPGFNLRGPHGLRKDGQAC